LKNLQQNGYRFFAVLAQGAEIAVSPIAERAALEELLSPHPANNAPTQRGDRDYHDRAHQEKDESDDRIILQAIFPCRTQHGSIVNNVSEVCPLRALSFTSTP